MNNQKKVKRPNQQESQQKNQQKNQQSSVDNAKANPSLKKKLLLSLSLCSVLLFMLLGFSAYHIALEETNEILDKQMQETAHFLSETSIDHLDSTFKPNHHYNETDILIDIWPYQNSLSQAQQTPAQTSNSIRLARARSAHFQRYQSPIGDLQVFILPLADKQIQISQLMSVRQALAKELALGMLIPYVLLMPLVLFGLGWLVRRQLQPLESLQRTIASRDHQDLTAISTTQLPLEIIPTINELNSLFKRIEAAQKQQQQFIADAAHELRSPITALNLQLTVLQKTVPYPLEQEKHFNRLKSGLQRIQHLVTQMMELAHQDAQDYMPLENLDLSKHTRLVIEQLMYQARKKHIDLGLKHNQENENKEIDPVIWVKASVMQLQSIIFNIIDNAIKYTPEGGRIDISLGTQTNSSQLYGCLCVEDSGSGVNPDDYSKLAERFVRLPTAHQQAVGSGLGLSIVSTAIGQLNGQLHFAPSARLGGLAVSVMLPLVTV